MGAPNLYYTPVEIEAIEADWDKWTITEGPVAGTEQTSSFLNDVVEACTTEM